MITEHLQKYYERIKNIRKIKYYYVDVDKTVRNRFRKDRLLYSLEMQEITLDSNRQSKTHSVCCYICGRE